MAQLAHNHLFPHRPLIQQRPFATVHPFAMILFCAPQASGTAHKHAPYTNPEFLENVSCAFDTLLEMTLLGEGASQWNTEALPTSSIGCEYGQRLKTQETETKEPGFSQYKRAQDQG